MPTTGPTQTASSAGSSTGPPPGTTVTKIEPPVKQIAICVAPAPTSGASTTQVRGSNTTATAVPVSVVSSVTGTPATMSSAAFFSGQQNSSVSGLQMLVTRFAGDSRPQFVLHPRAMAGSKNPIVVTTSNASGVPSQRVVIPQTAPLRTIVQGGTQHAANSIQVTNLSVSNPTANNVNPQLLIKQNITGTTRTINTFPFDDKNVVFLTNDSTPRPIRLQAGDLFNVKTTTPVAGNVKISRTPVTGAQTRQVINIATTGANAISVGAAGVNPQQITRLGIIQPTGAGGVAKGGQVINIKVPPNQLVINPSTSTLASAGTVVGSFTTHGQASHGKSTVIPVNPVMTIAAGQLGRHTIIPGTQISTSANFASNQRIITGNTIHAPQHVVSLAPATTTLKAGGVMSSSGASPIKQANVAATTPSSPRPSILTRKRTNINDNQAVPTSVTVLKTSQVVTSTKPLMTFEAVKMETNDSTMMTDHDQLPSSQSSTATASSQEATPRKKPRKQLLEPFNLSTSANIKLLSSDDGRDVRVNRLEVEEDVEESDDISQEDLDDEESIPEPVVNQNARKPRLSLIHGHGMPWKSLQHHFLRYSDVKPKPEKKLTLSELSNEGLQKKNGWKIHHLATQMEDMSDNESEINERLNRILEKFDQKVAPLPTLEEPINPDYPVKVSIGEKLSDLIRGNIQRSTIFQEQVNESRQLLIKLTNDHRERVGRLTRKNINKRTCISK